jgi:hypothetical protein
MVVARLGVHASDDAGLDTTLVHATQDKDVTIRTPRFVPGVSHDPVVLAGVGVSAPAKHPDGVSAYIIAIDR